MSDAGAWSELTDDDITNLWTFLLGGRVISNVRDPVARQATIGNAGVLRRLLQSFQGDPVGPMERFAALGAVTRLDPPDAANSATLSVEVQNCRVTFDGTTPTAANGLLLTTGSLYTFTGRPTLVGAQLLEAVAGSIVTVCYFT